MKELIKCTNCGELVAENTMYEFDGNFYCEECFHDLFTVCDECGCCVPNDEIVILLFMRIMHMHTMVNSTVNAVMRS